MLNNFIGGGQVFLHKIRMFSQVFFRTLNVSLIVGIIIAGCTYYNNITKLDRDAFILIFFLWGRFGNNLKSEQTKKGSGVVLTDQQ